jgi:diguanylate cyclase (GGDEF)-like protein
MSMAIIDIDHFKRFNDTYGHPAGDRMLKETAAAWQEQLRTGDHLARYGGEEFVVLLPDATPAQAREVIDRMRLATPLGQTFSAGLALWDGAETSDELTARADTALYKAKNAGRNRIVEDRAESVRA